MKLKKSTIVLLVCAVIFFGMSIVSNNYSVSRTEKAIEAIGELKYGDASIERFKKAAEYYDALDQNKHLDKKIKNAKELKQARLDYAKIMIKAAQLAYKKQDQAADAVAAAREAIDTYVSSEDVWSIENYQELLDLETIYNGNNGAPADAGEAPPMC